MLGLGSNLFEQGKPHINHKLNINTASLGEDTHKKSVFFSGRTTKDLTLPP